MIITESDIIKVLDEFVIEESTDSNDILTEEELSIMSELYNSYIEIDNIVDEGANIEMTKSYIKGNSTFKTHIVKAKNFILKKKYYDAKDELNEASKDLDKLVDVIKKADSDIGSDIFGAIAASLLSYMYLLLGSSSLRSAKILNKGPKGKMGPIDFMMLVFGHATTNTVLKTSDVIKIVSKNFGAEQVGYIASTALRKTFAALDFIDAIKRFVHEAFRLCKLIVNFSKELKDDDISTENKFNMYRGRLLAICDEFKIVLNSYIKIVDGAIKSEEKKKSKKENKNS